MIESGLYQFLTSNSTIRGLLGYDQVNKRYSVFFSVIPKGAIFPAIRLFRVASPNAAETLDLPEVGSQSIAGRFQFDALAGDATTNPVNPSGYLSAAMLSRAIRLQLLAKASSPLPDGTLVEDVRIHDEFDADFEQGGTGYLFRRVLDTSIIFEEGDYPQTTPQFYQGDGPPTELHDDDDVYYDQSTGNIYEQVASAWVQVGNVTPGGDVNFATAEVPSGGPTVWTLANVPIAGSEAVYINSNRMTRGAGNDYTIAGNTITVLAPVTIREILVDYRF